MFNNILANLKILILRKKTKNKYILFEKRYSSFRMRGQIKFGCCYWNKIDQVNCMPLMQVYRECCKYNQQLLLLFLLRLCHFNYNINFFADKKNVSFHHLHRCVSLHCFNDNGSMGRRIQVHRRVQPSAFVFLTEMPEDRKGRRLLHLLSRKGQGIRVSGR